jgi:hypothetical protein
MATVEPFVSATDFPPEMIAAAQLAGGRDADRVAVFLNRLGLRATPEKPMPMRAWFLLHLAAALRILEWEAQGFFFHREAGLPNAKQALRDAFITLRDPAAADPTEFCWSVQCLSLERFAWSGPTDLGADIAMDDVEEDLLLEALADFLWTLNARTRS